MHLPQLNECKRALESSIVSGTFRIGHDFGQALLLFVSKVPAGASVLRFIKEVFGNAIANFTDTIPLRVELRVLCCVRRKALVLPQLGAVPASGVPPIAPC